MRASSRSGAKRAAAEQHELGEVVVEARAAAAADHGDARRAERERVVERELEVGRLLVDRVALDAHAGAPRQPPRPARSTESRSPTSTSTAQAERRRVLEARVGRDHEGAGWQRAHLGEIGRRAAAHDQGAAAASRLPPATPRGECARIASCAWSRWEICCSTSSCGWRRRPRAMTTCPAAIALVPGGQAANVAAWVCWLGGEARLVARRTDDAAGRADRGRAASGAASSWRGRSWQASARAPWSPSSRPTARARSPATAAQRASSGPDDVDEAMLAGADVLHVAGYTLLRGPGRRGGAAAGGSRPALRCSRDRRSVHGARDRRSSDASAMRSSRGRARSPTSCSRTRPRRRRSASRSGPCGWSSAARSVAPSSRAARQVAHAAIDVESVVDTTGAGRCIRRGLPARERSARRGAARAGGRGALRDAGRGAAVSARLRVAPEVADALASGAPLVCLETTLVAHGFPAGRGVRGGRVVRGRRARGGRRARDRRHPRRRRSSSA